MKGLAILLLLVNILLLGWAFQREEADPNVPSVVRPGVGNLKLLSELSGNNSQEIAPAALPEERGERDSAEGGVTAETEAVSEAQPEPVTDLPVEPEQAPPALDDITAENEEAAAATVTAETSNEAAPIQAVPPQALQEKKVVLICGAFGPYERGAEARTLAESLASQGMDASLRRESMQKPIGYWVVIPPLENQQAAIEKVGQLRKSGITDLRRFVKGEQKNGISLGVFSSKNNAESRRQEVAKKGHAATVVPRLIAVPTYWVDYRAEQEQVAKVVGTLDQRNEAIKNQEYPCSRVVTSGGIF
ncbi:MAG: SPOR domain-containing protein [Sedimenticola sp.]|nr:SPOR domain-containing protein [Sedimenticola sp.]